MKALQQVGYGGPREAIQVIDLPDPEPGPDDIVIEMLAVPVHGLEVRNTIDPTRVPKNQLPKIPGLEGCGCVVFVGKNVGAFKEGDLALPPPRSGTYRQYICASATECFAAPNDADPEQLALVLINGMTSALLFDAHNDLAPGRWVIHNAANSSCGRCGTFRQKVAAKAEACTPAPEGDAIQLALTTLNAMTAYILVEDIAAPAEGEWIIQNGANSSCGRFVIALAKLRGAKTVDIVRRPELIDELKALGADAVVMETGDPDATAKQVREAAGGANIEFGFDCVAATGTVTIARCLGDSGTVVNYGFMTGKNAEMAFQDLFGKNISLEGMSMRTDRTAWERKEVLQKLADLTADGTLEAKIAGTFTLDQTQEAFALQAKTGTERPGKIVILPNG